MTLIMMNPTGPRGSEMLAIWLLRCKRMTTQHFVDHNNCKGCHQVSLFGSVLMILWSWEENHNTPCIDYLSKLLCEDCRRKDV
jgi:hypothetical protein